MKKFFTGLFQTLKKLFFPPPTASRGRKILPYAVMGVLTLAAFVGGTYGWEYTNSPEFCGTTCHTMPPEYSAYLVSPHARVECVECHLGRDGFAARFTRKAGDLRHVFLNITKQYEYPIQAHNMRPARESCETCHFPEKFSNDSLEELYFYQPNENNTPYNLYLIMHTGGGTAREGLGLGIHWHIENVIQYLPMDELEQDIPYIRVQNTDGTTTEYIDISSDLTSADINEDDLVTMDCITCHNRITHKVPKPSVAISQALRKGLISDQLPYVVRESLSLLTAEYPDKPTAIDSMNNLALFYEKNYPNVYVSNYDDIVQAISTLQDIYNQSVFPDQEVDWNSHPDNLGHQDDPGCFRCHNGKHFSEEGEAVRLECNLCHSIPIISGPTQLVTDLEVSSGPEPVSHTLTTWIALHGRVKDNSCKACHTTPAGVDDLATMVGKPPSDGSFCGNEACHSTVFPFAGFNDPDLEPLLSEQLEELIASMPPEVEDVTPPAEGATLTYYGEIQNLLEARCSACHGEGASGGLNVTTYETLLAGGHSGPGVVPGDPDSSMIYIRQTADTNHYFQLSDDEVALIREWILAGAPEQEP